MKHCTLLYQPHPHPIPQMGGGLTLSSLVDSPCEIKTKQVNGTKSGRGIAIMLLTASCYEIYKKNGIRPPSHLGEGMGVGLKCRIKSNLPN